MIRDLSLFLCNRMEVICKPFFSVNSTIGYNIGFARRIIDKWSLWDSYDFSHADLFFLTLDKELNERVRLQELGKLVQNYLLTYYRSLYNNDTAIFNSKHFYTSIVNHIDYYLGQIYFDDRDLYNELKKYYFINGNDEIVMSKNLNIYVNEKQLDSGMNVKYFMDKELLLKESIIHLLKVGNYDEQREVWNLLKETKILTYKSLDNSIEENFEDIIETYNQDKVLDYIENNTYIAWNELEEKVNERVLIYNKSKRINEVFNKDLISTSDEIIRKVEEITIKTDEIVEEKILKLLNLQRIQTQEIQDIKEQNETQKYSEEKQKTIKSILTQMIKTSNYDEQKEVWNLLKETKILTHNSINNHMDNSIEENFEDIIETYNQDKVLDYIENNKYTAWNSLEEKINERVLIHNKSKELNKDLMYTSEETVIRAEETIEEKILRLLKLQRIQTQEIRDINEQNETQKYSEEKQKTIKSILTQMIKTSNYDEQKEVWNLLKETKILTHNSIDNHMDNSIEENFEDIIKTYNQDKVLDYIENNKYTAWSSLEEKINERVLIHNKSKELNKDLMYTSEETIEEKILKILNLQRIQTQEIRDINEQNETQKYSEKKQETIKSILIQMIKTSNYDEQKEVWNLLKETKILTHNSINNHMDNSIKENFEDIIKTYNQDKVLNYIENNTYIAWNELEEKVNERVLIHNKSKDINKDLMYTSEETVIRAEETIEEKILKLLKLQRIQTQEIQDIKEQNETQKYSEDKQDTIKNILTQMIKTSNYDEQKEVWNLLKETKILTYNSIDNHMDYSIEENFEDIIKTYNQDKVLDYIENNKYTVWNSLEEKINERVLIHNKSKELNKDLIYTSEETIEEKILKLLNLQRIKTQEIQDIKEENEIQKYSEEKQETIKSILIQMIKTSNYDEQKEVWNLLKETKILTHNSIDNYMDSSIEENFEDIIEIYNQDKVLDYIENNTYTAWNTLEEKINERVLIYNKSKELNKDLMYTSEETIIKTDETIKEKTDETIEEKILKLLNLQRIQTQEIQDIKEQNETQKYSEEKQETIKSILTQMIKASNYDEQKEVWNLLKETKILTHNSKDNHMDNSIEENFEDIIETYNQGKVLDYIENNTYTAWNTLEEKINERVLIHNKSKELNKDLMYTSEETVIREEETIIKTDETIKEKTEETIEEKILKLLNLQRIQTQEIQDIKEQNETQRYSEEKQDTIKSILTQMIKTSNYDEQKEVWNLLKETKILTHNSKDNHMDNSIEENFEDIIETYNQDKVLDYIENNTYTAWNTLEEKINERVLIHNKSKELNKDLIYRSEETVIREEETIIKTDETIKEKTEETIEEKILKLLNLQRIQTQEIQDIKEQNETQRYSEEKRDTIKSILTQMIKTSNYDEQKEVWNLLKETKILTHNSKDNHMDNSIEENFEDIIETYNQDKVLDYIEKNTYTTWNTLEEKINERVLIHNKSKELNKDLIYTSEETVIREEETIIKTDETIKEKTEETIEEKILKLLNLQRIQTQEIQDIKEQNETQRYSEEKQETIKSILTQMIKTSNYDEQKEVWNLLKETKILTHNSIDNHMDNSIEESFEDIIETYNQDKVLDYIEKNTYTTWNTLEEKINERVLIHNKSKELNKDLIYTSEETVIRAKETTKVKSKKSIEETIINLLQTKRNQQKETIKTIEEEITNQQKINKTQELKIIKYQKDNKIQKNTQKQITHINKPITENSHRNQTQTQNTTQVQTQIQTQTKKASPPYPQDNTKENIIAALHKKVKTIAQQQNIKFTESNHIYKNQETNLTTLYKTTNKPEIQHKKSKEENLNTNLIKEQQHNIKVLTNKVEIQEKLVSQLQKNQTEFLQTNKTQTEVSKITKEVVKQLQGRLWIEKMRRGLD